MIDEFSQSVTEIHSERENSSRTYDLSSTPLEELRFFFPSMPVTDGKKLSFFHQA